MPRDDEGIYCVKVEFQPGSPDPTRVFRAMAQLINALGTLDAALATSVGADIKPTVLLEGIDTGSLRAWLRDKIDTLDDEDVRDLNWKRMVGSFLVKGKRAVVRLLSDRRTISSRDEIRALQAEVMTIAEETGVTSLPTYTAVPPNKLLKAASDLAAAVGHLSDTDRASFLSDDGEIPISPNFAITVEAVEMLLTRETIPSDAEMILKVKKPDYLGTSMWEFRHDQHPIAAKILDIAWLRRFQSREEHVRPGDSIRARVHTEVKYGYNSEVVAVHHEVIEVLAVIPYDRDMQIPLLPPPSGSGSVDMS